jgi:hypothetical protein
VEVRRNLPQTSWTRTGSHRPEPMVGQAMLVWRRTGLDRTALGLKVFCRMNLVVLDSSVGAAVRHESKARRRIAEGGHNHLYLQGAGHIHRELANHIHLGLLVGDHNRYSRPDQARGIHHDHGSPYRPVAANSPAHMMVASWDIQLEAARDSRTGLESLEW